jgi:hypothetical protein
MSYYLLSLKSDNLTIFREIKTTLNSSIKSIFLSYCFLNPDLSYHPIYLLSYPEHLRICFSRCHLSAHRLKIETGRWARIVKELHLCTCGKIQDEYHVVIECPKTDNLREKYYTILQ